LPQRARGGNLDPKPNVDASGVWQTPASTVRKSPPYVIKVGDVEERAGF
jgi:hypothetical protein